MEEIGTDAVHLVYERESRNFVLVCLSPNGLGLRLYTAYRAENSDRAVKDSQ